MADLSLDEYITKRVPNVSFNKRLGQKVSPGKSNLKFLTTKSVGQRIKVSPQFKVVGLGNVNANFDARQKLTRKQNKFQVKDAREKIVQKLKQVDARTRIQNRTGSAGQPVTKTLSRNGGTGAQSNTQGIQIRVQNVPSKPVDARQMIKSKQQTKGQAQIQRPFQTQSHTLTMQQQRVTGQLNPKVTVTGLRHVTSQRADDQHVTGARHSAMVRHLGNTVQKVVSNNQQQLGYQNSPSVQRNFAVRKTVENVDFVPMPTSRVGNNIIISPESASVITHKTVVASEPEFENYFDSSYEEQCEPAVQYTSMHSDIGQIQVENDAYRQLPEQVSVQHEVVSRPVFQQSYYTEPKPAVPIAAGPPAAPVRSQVDRMTRTSQPTSTLSMVQSRLGEDPNTAVSIQDVSPLQGYRVLITNLHHIVTQDDILELFGAVGALKKVRLLRAGTAEVIFVKKEDAVAAIRKYNNRELDGQPMKVVLTSGSSTTPVVQPTSQPVNPEVSRLQKGTTSEAPVESSPVAEVDLSLLHKALFKTTSKDDPPSRPVTFTVKI